MLDDLPYGEAVALTIALIPALLQWWSGRAFVRAIDDPTLPERLAANQRRSGSVFGVAVGVLIVGWPAEWFWTIPLVVTGRIAAMYPLRRSLYNETWSFAGYLWFVARGLLAFCGFWLGLVWMPLFATTRSIWSGGAPGNACAARSRVCTTRAGSSLPVPAMIAGTAPVNSLLRSPSGPAAPSISWLLATCPAVAGAA